MGRLIDLTGQKFGRLTVLERDLSRKGVYWICRCDCGNIKSILGQHLKSKHTQSCGCLQKERASEANLKNLVGERFGKLIVLKIDDSKKGNQGQLYWICQCDCGKIKSILGTALKNGDTISCGCSQEAHRRALMEEYDLSGQAFGKLIVVERDEMVSGERKRAHYLCQCECGNAVIVSGQHLRSGHTTSCGCSLSKGELKIIEILKNQKISFKTQFSFDNLKGDNKKLRFDFAIIKDKELICLIEYQGKQHYNNLDFFGGESALKKQKRYDDLKREYCKNNNIKLIEIPYCDYNKINAEYLLQKIFKRGE